MRIKSEACQSVATTLRVRSCSTRTRGAIRGSDGVVDCSGGKAGKGPAHLSQRALFPFEGPANSKLTASFAEAALVVFYFEEKFRRSMYVSRIILGDLFFAGLVYSMRPGNALRFYPMGFSLHLLAWIKIKHASGFRSLTI
jgi:hypothetical protein